VDPEDWGPTFNLALLDHSRDNVRSVLHTVEENLEAANKALDTARVALRDLCREDDEYDGWLNRPYPYHKKITKAEYRESVEHRVKRRRRFEE